MKTSIRIGIKFCGNCNPYVDTIELLDKLKSHYKKMEFVKWDEEDYLILLILNSCPVGCATHPDFSGPTIIVKSDSINCEPALPEDLFDRMITSINEYIKI